MKALIAVVVILFVVAFAAIITKPTDQQCVELAKSNVNTSIYNSSSNSIVKGIESLFVDAVPKMLFRVEDNLFYKTVYLKFDNTKVGVVIFGTFINSANTSPASNSEDSFPNSSPGDDGHAEGNQEQPTHVKEDFTDSPPAPAPSDTMNSDAASPDNSNNNEDKVFNAALENLKAKIYAAKDKMQRIKEFHFLRSNREREQQIERQALYIQYLEKKIGEFERLQKRREN